MSTPITDRAQKVLAEIDAALALADNAHGDAPPDYTHCQGLADYYEAATNDSGWPASLRCLKTAIEGLLAAKEWNEWTGEEFTPSYASESLAAICDQWRAGK
jgi:hypothetical protein